MRTFVIAMLGVFGAPTAAFAESDRMSTGEYIKAAKCLAYAGLPALQDQPSALTDLRARLRQKIR
jgi:hypothetical protein